MLTGIVMMCALFAVAFGYVVFSRSATSGGILWDVGFVTFCIGFLVGFVCLIWRHVVSDFFQDSE